MARVLALVPDLLFGSRVQSALTQAGHDVELTGDSQWVRGELGTPDVSVLVVDLTNDQLDGAALVSGLAHDGLLQNVKTLGFYAHVDVEVRARAEQAGFSLVVPRSRMAREGAELVERLLASASDSVH
jgi:DNA-binding NtrC family response regulator